MKIVISIFCLPYEIDDVYGLQAIKSSLTSNYSLTGTIDASSTSNWNASAGFDPLGDNITKFSGSLDANGFNVENLFIDRSAEDYVGLFGYISSAGAIEQIGITNADITGNQYVGALAGYNEAA